MERLGPVYPLDSRDAMAGERFAHGRAYIAGVREPSGAVLGDALGSVGGVLPCGLCAGSWLAEEMGKNFFKKPLAFLKRVCYTSKVVKRRQKKIRVWRSLVSRLTGGQEAAGSSPVTRTKRALAGEAGALSFCPAIPNLRPLGAGGTLESAAQAARTTQWSGRRFKSCHSDQEGTC